MSVRILVVDDQPLLLQGVAGLLNAQPDFCVVGTAASVRAAVLAARDLQPDLVLMDFSLPDGTGLDATLPILADRPATSIVFLTVFDDDDRLFAALRHGAKGYLLKNISGVDLVAALRAVVRGEAALAPTLSAHVVKEFARLPHPDGGRADEPLLTDREHDVLRELGTGASNDEIAARLMISLSTVKNHIHNILTKLHVRNRREAIIYARSGAGPRAFRR